MTPTDPIPPQPAPAFDLDALEPVHPGLGRSYAPLRTIAALILREMSTRFGRKVGGYIWVLLQPVAMIIILSIAWSMLMRTPNLGTSFLLFKGTGMLILTMFRTISSMVGRSMSFSRPLLAYPGVTWIDAILARFILNALVVVLVAWIILTGIILYEDIRTVLDWPRVLLAVSLALLLGLGWGVLNCYLFQRVPVWENVWSIFTAPLFIISGVLIIYEDMPPLAQQILWYNPLLHVTGFMRDGFYPIYRPEYVSVLYVTLWALLPMVVGLLLLRRYHRELLQR